MSHPDASLPHGSCYLWRSELLCPHVSSDSLIGFAYVAIPVTLAYVIYRARRDIPFQTMFLTFRFLTPP